MNSSSCFCSYRLLAKNIFPLQLIHRSDIPIDHKSLQTRVSSIDLLTFPVFNRNTPLFLYSELSLYKEWFCLVWIVYPGTFQWKSVLFRIDSQLRFWFLVKPASAHHKIYWSPRYPHGQWWTQLNIVFMLSQNHTSKVYFRPDSPANWILVHPSISKKEQLCHNW